MGLTNIKIDYEVQSFNKGGYDEDFSYSRDSYDHTNSIKGIEIKEDNEFCHFKVPFEIKPGVPYYLVYVEYTSGDSFGSDSGNIEFVMLYEDLAQADSVAKSIRKQEDNFTIEIEMPNKQMVKLSAPWTGYFESLDGIYVEPVILNQVSY